MKRKVNELQGEALDAAVARAEGYTRGTALHGGYPTWVNTATGDWIPQSEYKPSRAWSDGGPIIDRESIVFLPLSQVNTDPPHVHWRACCLGGPRQDGPTHLIAGMRAFVAFRVGQEIDV